MTLTDTIRTAIAVADATSRGARGMATRARRAYARSRAVPRSIPTVKTLTVVRSTTPVLYSFSAGGITTYNDPALQNIQYSDLTSAYDRFRINWVEAYITPQYDPGQSGVTNNAIMTLYLACDPGGHYTAPTELQVGAFDNHRVFHLAAGKTYRYRFQPKPVNALAAGSFASSTDWLFSSASGAGVLHQRLLISATAANASDTLGIVITYRFNVTFKGVY